jgi:hypothetical protein
VQRVTEKERLFGEEEEIRAVGGVLPAVTDERDSALG